MIAFACIHCQSMLKVETQSPGQKVKCPRCMNVVNVPMAATVGSGSGASSHDAASEESPSPSLQDTVAGMAPSQEGEIASMLAPAREPGELGWLGPYRVLKILGHGGMGVVFHAEDPQLGRAVALKAILPRYARNPNARQRFIREARAAAGLKHDNIVSIYQVGEDRGIPYQAMEFLDGQSLEKYLLRKQQVPVAEVLRIGRDIANGLAVAHAQSLIHRDIKPANIWLEKKKETAAGLASVRVKILDFGLARDAKEDTSITQSGTIVGTPAYMAPEQAKGQTVGPRSDLFSLGCLLYRLTTGQLPFQGDNTLAILASLASETPPAPRMICPEMPKAASEFIMKLIEKDPERRPASARETADTLGRLLREFRHAAKSDPVLPKLTWNPRWRRWGWWAAGAGALLVLVLIIALVAISGGPAGDAGVDPAKALPPNPVVKGNPAPVEPGNPSDDSLLGRLRHDAIPADDMAWAFGAGVKPPREVVALIRNRSAATVGDARLADFALSQDERWLALGGPGLQVDTYDFATGKSHVGTRSAGALEYFFSLGKSTLITGNASGQITSRNLLTHQEVVLYSAGVQAASYAGAPDTPTLILGGVDGKIYFLNPINWKKLDSVTGHSRPVIGLLFRPEAKKMISADETGKVIVWSAPSAKTPDNLRFLPKIADPLPESLFPKDHGQLRQIAFGADFNTLLVAFAGSPSIERVALDRKSLGAFPTRTDVAAFSMSPDRKTLATISPRGQLRVWSYLQERMLAEVALPPLENESYGPVQFAPDGRHFLVGHPRGAVAVVRVF